MKTCLGYNTGAVKKEQEELWGVIQSLTVQFDSDSGTSGRSHTHVTLSSTLTLSNAVHAVMLGVGIVYDMVHVSHQ